MIRDHRTASVALRQSLTEITADCSRLMALQCELTWHDTQRANRRLPLLGAALGSCLIGAIAAVQTACVGGVFVLHDTFAMKWGVACACVTGMALALSGAGAALTVLAARRVTAEFSATREEMRANLTFLRELTQRRPPQGSPHGEPTPEAAL